MLSCAAPSSHEAAALHLETQDGKRITIPVNLKKVKRGKAEDPVLQKDDLVLVPESFF